VAVFERDPACQRFIQPVLFFKGFQAVQAYRIGNWLYREGRKDLAYFVQMRASESFGVDVHPAAKIGKGIMIEGRGQGFGQHHDWPLLAHCCGVGRAGGGAADENCGGRACEDRGRGRLRSAVCFHGSAAARRDMRLDWGPAPKPPGYL